MRNLLIGGIVIAAVLSTAFVMHRSRSGGELPQSGTTTKVATVVDPTRPKERAVLFWKHPDGTSDFSSEPKKTADGRDYLPVFEDQEADFAPPKGKAMGAPTRAKGKLLYYRNPMGLADTSKVPKKDWMGMDYIPVYEGEDDSGSTVKVSLDKVQRTGVRTAPVELRRLERVVRAPGISKPDERTLRVVSLRADGFIEKLYVNQTGQHVNAGEPLFRVYSPEMVKVQVDYRIALGASGARDEVGPLQRMRNLGIPEGVLAEIQRTREPVVSFDWPSPVTGVVMRKPVMEGMLMRAGEEIFRFADLTNIWVIADVSEQDIAQVKIGANAQVSFRAFVGETFTGKVTLVLHELDTATRTAKVRIEIANNDLRIKHEMFADVVIDAAAGEAERLVVPLSALIDSGNRQVVLIDRGEGRFEPRPVKVGAKGEGVVEIAEGVKAGELVVVTANFLIDAESNLKAALQAFTAEPPAMENKP